MGLPFFLKSSVVKKYTLWPSNPPRQQSRKTLAIVKPPSLFSSNFSGMTAHSCTFTVDKNATCLLNKHGTSKHTGLNWMPLFIFELASLARTLSFLFIDSIAKKFFDPVFVLKTFFEHRSPFVFHISNERDDDYFNVVSFKWHCILVAFESFSF